MALSGAPPSNGPFGASAAPILDLAFSCQACGLSPLASAAQSLNEDLIRILPAAHATTDAVTAAVWVLECGHVFCKDHVRGKRLRHMIENHPQADAPAKQCPFILPRSLRGSAAQLASRAAIRASELRYG